MSVWRRRERREAQGGGGGGGKSSRAGLPADDRWHASSLPGGVERGETPPFTTTRPPPTVRLTCPGGRPLSLTCCLVCRARAREAKMIAGALIENRLHRQASSALCFTSTPLDIACRFSDSIL